MTDCAMPWHIQALSDRTWQAVGNCHLASTWFSLTLGLPATNSHVGSTDWLFFLVRAGLGALLARKDSLALLHKYYFGGGSVVDATGKCHWQQPVVQYAALPMLLDSPKPFNSPTFGQ